MDPQDQSSASHPDPMPRAPDFTDLPHDVYCDILSEENVGVLDILSLKQTCRSLRVTITYLLVEHPNIYRKKLALLAKMIPTGLPKDLSAFSVKELEAVALSSYAVDQRWNCDFPDLCRPHRAYRPDPEARWQLPVVAVLKVVPGGRWVIAGLDSGCLSVWDSVDEIIVAKASCGSMIDWIELEMVSRGQVTIAVTGKLEDEPAPRHALSVYSLQLYPSPESQNDDVLVKKGYVLAPNNVQTPAIRGNLACAIYLERGNENDEFGIVVYDWQTDSAKILTLKLPEEASIPWEFHSSLLILSHKISLFSRSRNSPAFSTIKIPELSPLDQNPPSGNEILSSRLPPSLAVVSEDIDGGDDASYYIPSMCRVVEFPSPSSQRSTLSLISLALDTEDFSNIMCDLTKLDWSSKSPSMTSEERLRRPVRVNKRLYDLGFLDEPWRPLMALGHTGKRAVWIESCLGSIGGLVGFTDIGHSVDYEDQNSSDLAGDDERLEERCQVPEFFIGNSPLRRLPTTSLHMFAGITALGFDEATATVVMGNSKGQVLVLNYGPKNAVR